MSILLNQEQFIEAYDAIVRFNPVDSVFRCKDCLTKGIVASDTDFSTVMNYAFAHYNRIFVHRSSNPFIAIAQINVHNISDVTVHSNGAVIKMADNYQPHVVIDIANVSNVTFEGFTFDGNRDGNQPTTDIVFTLLHTSSSVTFRHCIFKKTGYTALVLGEPNQSIYGFLCESCTFYDNTDTVGSGCDVYSPPNIDLQATFKDCTFTREAWGINGKQAFYMNTKYCRYENCYFKNVSIAFDLRSGIHEIAGAFGDTLKLAISTSIGTPTVIARQLDFINVKGLAGVQEAAIYINTGKAFISHSNISCTGTDAHWGIAFGVIDGGAVEYCDIGNSTLAGVFLNGCKNVRIKGNKISNTSVGIRTINCSGLNYAKDNEFVNLSGDYFYRPDGMLRVDGVLGLVLRNSGESVGTGSQQTIPHGLAQIPNRIKLTNNDDGANPHEQDRDETNIYVTAVSGKRYTWEVEYR